MNISISLPTIMCVVACVATTAFLFKILASNDNDYGFGSVLAFFLSGFLSMFYIAILFAGAYFKLWWA